MKDEIDHGFDVCRLCLTDAHLSTLFDDDWALTKKFHSLSGVDLSQDLDDDIPALICDDCLNDLNKTPQEPHAMGKAKLYEDVYFEPRREAKINETTPVNAPSMKQPEGRASKTKTSKGEERGNNIIPVQDSTVCPTCHRIFSSRHGMKNHLERVHLKVKNFFCDGCQFSCFEKNKVMRHLLRYHAGLKSQRPEVLVGRKKSNTCKHCNKTFSGRSAYSKHVKQSHLKLKNYFCDLCSFSSYLKEKMKIHMMSCHMTIKFSERKFKCEVAGCLSAFKLRSGLSRHLRLVHKISKSK